MSSPWRALVAVAVSCGVWLLPVPAPHVMFVSGGMVLISAREVLEGQRPVTWLAAELALMLGVQAILATAAWRLLPRRRAVLAAVTAAGYLGAALLLPVMLMAVIPAWFLTERENAADKTPWPVVAEIRGADLASPQAAVTASLQDAGRLLVRSLTSNTWMLVDVPSMTGTDLRVPCGHFATNLVGVTRRGQTLVSVLDPPSGVTRWWWIETPGAAPVQAMANPGTFPFLRLDPARGAVVAMSASGPSNAVLHAWSMDGSFQAEARELEGTVRQSITFYAMEGAESVWCFRNGTELAAYDGQGRSRPPVRDIGGVPLGELSFMQNRAGRVTWELYREGGPCRLAWDVTGSPARVVELPRGKAASHASLSPDGRFVAVSSTPSLNVGNRQDAVVAYDTTTGAEVLRITLPRYSRTEVWFPGTNHFACTVLKGTNSTVVVREIR